MIFNIGRGKPYKLPVLNASYPANATVVINNSATFEVEIATAGNPESYTYQWYVNGSAVSGATNSSYTYTPTAIGTTSIYCKVTNTAGTVQSRTATLTAIALYLYNAGDSCTAITGGWQRKGRDITSTNNNADPPMLTLDASSMTAWATRFGTSGSGGTIETTNDINVSGYNTLSVTFTLIQNPKKIGICVYDRNISIMGSSYDAPFSNTKAYTEITTEASSKVTYTVDISSVSGNACIGIALYNAASDHWPKVTITEIKLS